MIEYAQPHNQSIFNRCSSDNGSISDWEFVQNLNLCDFRDGQIIKSMDSIKNVNQSKLDINLLSKVYCVHTQYTHVINECFL